MLTPPIARAAGTPEGRPGRLDTACASPGRHALRHDVYFAAFAVTRISVALSAPAVSWKYTITLSLTPSRSATVGVLPYSLNCRVIVPRPVPTTAVFGSTANVHSFASPFTVIDAPPTAVMVPRALPPVASGPLAPSFTGPG